MSLCVNFELIKTIILRSKKQKSRSNVGITEYNQGGEDDMMLMYYNTEADSYQPDEDVKVKMSFVLSELKSFVESGRKPERGNAYQKFAHVIDSSWQQNQPPSTQSQSKKAEQSSSRRKYLVYFLFARYKLDE